MTALQVPFSDSPFLDLQAESYRNIGTQSESRSGRSFSLFESYCKRLPAGFPHPADSCFLATKEGTRAKTDFGACVQIVHVAALPPNSIRGRSGGHYGFVFVPDFIRKVIRTVPESCGAPFDLRNPLKSTMKYKKCTPLYRIGTSVLTNTEHIDRYAEPPWHRVDQRVSITVPPNKAGKSVKKQWASRHRQLLKDISKDAGEVRVYTDGSLRHVRGVRYTGAGFVAYREDEAMFSDKFALGPCAEVYDAEMEGLAGGAERLRVWMESLPQDHGIRRVRFFADNTGAIQRVYKGTPGYDQLCSTRFREAIHAIVDATPNCRISVEWVPGHHGIEGNDVADDLAKRGSAKVPIRADYSTAAFAGNLCKKALRESWTLAWRAESETRHRSDYSDANRIPPSIKPSKHFRSLSRKTFSRVLQCRTGHAHIGEYYDYFSIDAPHACACGANYQTRRHILLECEQHEQHRHLLEDKDGNVDIKDLIGSTSGIMRLANFIAAADAYDKPPPAQP